MLLLHEAERIIDDECSVLKKEALYDIQEGSTVRISIFFDEEPNEDLWTHDAPYVKILKIKGNDLLGEVLEKNKRFGYNHKYPLPIGEKVWFKRSNIIEISGVIKPEFITTERVLISGPLYTVVHQEHSYSDSESDSSHSTGDTFL
jgi:hypothetical protein